MRKLQRSSARSPKENFQTYLAEFSLNFYVPPYWQQLDQEEVGLVFCFCVPLWLTVEDVHVAMASWCLAGRERYGHVPGEMLYKRCVCVEAFSVRCGLHWLVCSVCGG